MKETIEEILKELESVFNDLEKETKAKARKAEVRLRAQETIATLRVKAQESWPLWTSGIRTLDASPSFVTFSPKGGGLRFHLHQSPSKRHLET